MYDLARVMIHVDTLLGRRGFAARIVLLNDHLGSDFATLAKLVREEIS